MISVDFYEGMWTAVSGPEDGFFVAARAETVEELVNSVARCLVGSIEIHLKDYGNTKQETPEGRPPEA